MDRDPKNCISIRSLDMKGFLHGRGSVLFLVGAHSVGGVLHLTMITRVCADWKSGWISGGLELEQGYRHFIHSHRTS